MNAYLGPALTGSGKVMEGPSGGKVELELSPKLLGLVTVLGVLVGIVGAVVGIAALPSSLQGLQIAFGVVLALAVVAAVVTVLAVVIRWAVYLPIRAARASEERAVHSETLLDAEIARVRTYQTVLWDVSERHPAKIRESQSNWIYVGSDDSGDKMHEEYETTALDAHGLLWRAMDAGSRSAFSTTGGHMTLADCGVSAATMSPLGDRQVTLIETQYDDRRLTGLVIFRPGIAKNESVRWSLDYRVPGAWSELRTKGNDRYSVEIGSRCPYLSVKVIFDKAEPTAKCVVEIPKRAVAHGIPQACTRLDTGGITTFEWAAQDPPAGWYTFSLSLGRVQTQPATA
jgi:hypothetical protein